MSNHLSAMRTSKYTIILFFSSSPPQKKNILHQIFHITPLMIFFFAIFAQIFVFFKKKLE